MQYSERVLGRILDGEFDEDDVEQSILSGSITKVQRDELYGAADGNKYTITGRDSSGLPFMTTGKVIQTFEGTEYFLITAHPRC